MSDHKSSSGRRKPRLTRKVAAVSAVAFLVIVGSAFGFYLALFANGSGSGSSKLGEASTPTELALKVTFAAGLLPGHEEPVSVQSMNPATSAGQIRTLQLEPVSHTAGCISSWFSIRTETKQATEIMGSGLATPITDQPNTEIGLGVEGIKLSFIDSGTNQNACSGANLEVVAHSQP
jgi:hypothetical protein